MNSTKESEAKVVLDEKSKLFYRPDLGELFVIDEQKQYKGLDFKGKTVMDVGAHIGCFTDLALKNGAEYVWAYEPTEESYALLIMNTFNEKVPTLMPTETLALRMKTNFFSEKELRELSLNNKVTTYNCALIGTDEKFVDFYLSKKYPSCHTHIPVKGREQIRVRARNFWERVSLHKPEILKIDVEGGEYDFIFLETIPDYVEQVAIELHLGKKGFRELGIKAAKLFGDWQYHSLFRFSWHITTLVLHRNKKGRGLVKERIEELDL